MKEQGRDLGVLSVLPLQASGVNSLEDMVDWLQGNGGAERSRQIAAMPKNRITHFVSLLTTATGSELLASVDADAATRIIRYSDLGQRVRLIESLDFDDSAEIVRRLGRALRETLLTNLNPEYAEGLTEMLRWPAQSVATHMIQDVFTIESILTVADAEAAVRLQSQRVRGKDRVGARIYATDADRRLTGFVEFQDLVLAQPDQLVSQIMSEDTTWVRPLVPAEEAARALVDHDLTTLPIVDEQRRLLGVLTAEAAADILSDEATKDAERQGGSAPLDVPYLRASPTHLWRKRILWLLVLFIAEAYTGTVLRAFEEELDAVVALAFFIPLLIGTGGNTGTQITTTLVRAMATGQVRMRDLPRVLLKEITTGLLVAVTMAAAGIARAWTLGVGWEITLTVSLTIAASVMWSALVASVLPPLLKKLKVDPAIVSAPMISTIVDGTGLIIYFLIAHATLPQLAGL